MATIYFVTNRNPNRIRDPDDFGKEFHRDSPENLRFGWAQVDGEVQRIVVEDESLNKDPKRAKLGSVELLAKLKRGMMEGQDTLCFIHGYSVSFRDALTTGAALHHAFAKPPGLQVVVFSWPSDGSMMPFLAYKRDRDDARLSGPALGRALLKVRDFLVAVQRGVDTCPGRLHLMAHSMGNYVLRNGLQAFIQKGGVLTRIFDNILLMAADEDHDTFEHAHKLMHLPELAGGVHVYFNPGDTALVLSDRTKSNPTRLGSQGPRLPHGVPGNVTIVDVGPVVGGVVEHSYFHNDPGVVEDVGQVLAMVAPDLIPRRRYVATQNRYVLESAPG